MPRQFINGFGDTPADTTGQSLLQSVLSPLVQSAEGQVTSALPDKQTIVQDYLGAIIAFWVVGAVALYLVKKL